MFRTCIVITILLLILINRSLSAQQSVFQNFITAKEGKLYDGDKEFRFISFNIPNLNYVEDEFAPEVKHPYRMPNTFELIDAMESVKQLGGQVIRNYTIPVRNIREESYPTYVLAPNKFDEESFKTMDTMLAVANKVGIRLILPFVNCWQWMGGRPQYAEFRDKTEDEFWTDPQLIEDVKATIKFVINRINSVTGIPYKDDKAILCWETGNELTAPFSWTREITRYIKSLDQNHLVMDGFNAINNTPFFEEALNEPSIDIVTTHHYEVDPSELFQNLDDRITQLGNRKVYVVGEFGFIGTPAIEHALNKIINSNIAGAMIWSLRYHRREGGFYWHSEPLGFGIYKAYHWPGFNSGNEYDEKNLLSLMRKKAFEIRGLPVPQLEIPIAPKLLPIENPAHISWQGSVGAATYDVERSETVNGNWQIVGFDIDDSEVQYFPLFNDESSEIGKSYFYRVTAKNSAGKSEYSNIVGPVNVENKCLVDNGNNHGNLFYWRGDVRIDSENDRVFREDMYRLHAEEDTEIIYMVNGKLSEINLFTFAEMNESVLEFFVSLDNLNYESLEMSSNSNFSGQEYYGYWVPINYHTQLSDASNYRYLKIVFKEKAQIGRVELFYKN
ncbi:MAG: hypothetical protein KF816_15435 [Melioribacteraceae bacterium]|nr:hypothetical protein [Melioribacteraceae bacterium]